MKTFNLSIVVPSRLPTEKAYGYQIMKFASMMSNESSINSINIINPYRKNLLKDNLFNYYDLNVNSKINIKSLGSIDFFKIFNLFGQSISFKIYLIIFFINIIKNKKYFKNHIIYLRDFNLSFFFILFKFYLKPKSIILEAHEEIIINQINRFLIKKIDHLLPISQKLYNFYKNINPRLLIINSITDENFIKKKFLNKNIFLKKLNAINNHPKIGIIGNSTTRVIDKGQRDLFNKLKYIKDFQFYFVGLDKNIFYEFSNIILNEKINNIFLFKKIKFKNIYKFYDLCDSFIIYYPFNKYFDNSSPVKLFECLASGKPIICNNNPSLISIIKNKKNCLLFDEDFDSLEKCLKISNDKNFRKIIKKNNKKLFYQFNIDNKISIIKKIINNENL